MRRENFRLLLEREEKGPERGHDEKNSTFQVFAEEKDKSRDDDLDTTI